MQLIQNNWLNNKFFGKYLFQKKYKLNNFFVVNKITQIVVSTPISAKENKHIDIAFWFMSILFQKKDFKHITKMSKRTLTGKKLNLVGLVLHLTGKNLFWKLRKIVYQLLPPQEYRYKYFVRSVKQNVYNFSFHNLTTYSESQMIYNDPKHLLISDLVLNFNFHCSSKNPLQFYFMFKLFKNFPIRISKQGRNNSREYKLKNNAVLWNLRETKLRERRYFKYKQKRLQKKNQKSMKTIKNTTEILQKLI